MSSLIRSIESHQGWPLVLLAGVAMVTLSVLADGLAALTGVALVGLGSAGCLAARATSTGRFDYVLLNNLVYGPLYLLFLGSLLHAGQEGPLLWADLAGSLIALAMLASLVRQTLR